MSINKTLVMQILTVLSEQIPKRVSVERLGLCDQQTLAKHLMYMAHEDLIDNDADEVVGLDTSGEISHFESCGITSLGISYIGRDDGIHKELHAVNISLDVNELRQLLLDNVAANAEPDQKQKLTNAIASLSRETLVEVCKELIVKGLTAGTVLTWLRNFIP
ncbi:hypothetical protein [Moraxella catarrhalis]|uniref:hypothetical protein n=1 Tax=Moraxella catarrhalis TaxID=480 RepID=UPI000202A452|nr:hypothetical protein [Moraxella catarrhalis]AKI27011.1 hypothetical protein [Moraxella phage Mcat1]AKI27062.1 hypothetical protein [Moraxella phage Mcat2]EGE18897.1 hypothetical protein E9U_08688 [Moraxella catarrhalis BC8]MPW52638.1 hypothetical protein [Moraxella catarrhalis]MPX09257.1 hypothetical protein [Moraxella catarrhalis]